MKLAICTFLTIFMFSAVACESEPEPEPDTVVAVMPHCTRGVYLSEKTYERLGEDCFNYADDEWSKDIYSSNRNKRWELTIKTAQGTTYTAEVQPSLRPQVGDTFP